MYNLQSLEVTHILPRKDGIFAFAKYPNWRYEYSFLIEPNGKVKGKTDAGIWSELSQQLGEFIKAKVQSILIEKRNLIYA